jgi:Rieske Fe-S protein
MFTKGKNILVLLLVLLLINSCRKKDQYIPYVEVDIYININNPSFFQLTSVSGWTYVNGGSKGLIVYRRTQEEFFVYDRHCTHNSESTCGTADVNADNVTVDCLCDGSQYLLYDGSVLKGPASYPLFQYRSTFDGTTLHIYN